MLRAVCRNVECKTDNLHKKRSNEYLDTSEWVFDGTHRVRLDMTAGGRTMRKTLHILSIVRAINDEEQ